MADDTHDLKFLHELVRRTDLQPDQSHHGREIATALGVPDGEVEGIVSRLQRRGLVTHHQPTMRLGDSNATKALIVTPAGYQLVGIGPLAD